jgi:hypothetical protein
MNFRAPLSAIVLACSLLPAQTFAQTAPDPWYTRSPRPRDFQLAKLPWDAFTMELPKDWQLVPGHGGVLLAATEKTKNNQAGAAFLLEHQQLQDSLSPKDIDAAMAQYEATAARQRDPGGQNFAAQVKDVHGQRFIFIEYTRKGLIDTDKVVVYEIPMGLVLYRLICIAPEPEMGKYQSTFAHVAWSFKLAGPNAKP